MGAQREIRLKLSRAEKHLCDLDAAVRLFCESKPYVLKAELDRIPGIDNVSFVAEFVQPIPAEISLIIGDAVHNLRSALDHLAYQLVLANGKAPTRNTEFPIGDPTKQYTASVHSGKVHGMATEAKDIIRSIQPSNTGDLTLWDLHALDIADKHRLLITTHQRLEAWSAGAIVLETYPLPLVEGESVMNIPRSTYERHPHKDYQIAIDIAFGEAEVAAYEAVVPHLRHAADVVSHTIGLFDRFF